MKCQVVGCERAAVIDDDDSGELCLCSEHSNITLVHYVEMPEVPQECQCAACIDRRRVAVAAYKLPLSLMG